MCSWRLCSQAGPETAMGARGSGPEKRAWKDLCVMAWTPVGQQVGINHEINYVGKQCDQILRLSKRILGDLVAQW